MHDMQVIKGTIMWCEENHKVFKKEAIAVNQPRQWANQGSGYTDNYNICYYYEEVFDKNNEGMEMCNAKLRTSPGEVIISRLL